MSKDSLKAVRDLTEELAELKGKKLVVFGAGRAGKRIFHFLQNEFESADICFCDNNADLQDEGAVPPVYSVKRAGEIADAFFVVGFLGNPPEKIESAVQCVVNAGVPEARIRIADMRVDYLKRIWITRAHNYVDRLICERAEQESVVKVKTIKFLTYGFSAEKEKEPGGGPIGAICMQKSFLGASFQGIRLEYPYYIPLADDDVCFAKFTYILGAVETVRRMFSQDKNTLYIANDIFSAFGLYSLGKPYCVLFHAQGDVVKERTLWGECLSDAEKELIYKMEKLAVENAYKTLFPSVGAERYFRDSFREKLDFCSGRPMYNAVTDFPTPKKVEGIGKSDSQLTFFSIGQMTALKGMDRIPGFLEEYIRRSGRKVRWIVVADGVLKEQVGKAAQAVAEKTGKLEYINIDYKVSHAEIFYLMQLCDVYIMLHRVSIFDFSTLEAMYFAKPVILSDIAGNDEYNQDNNIMLVGDDVNWNAVLSYIDNAERVGGENRRVYESCFAKTPFVERYKSLFQEFVANAEGRK